MKALTARLNAAFSRIALGFVPDRADLHLRLGRALHDLGRLTEAHPVLARAVELDGQEARAHFSLGTNLAALGCLNEARVAFARARRLDPGNPEIAFALGCPHLHSCGTIEL